MKKSYSIEPNLNAQYDQQALMMLNMMKLADFKSIADKNAVQFDICIKTDGVRINIIKKIQIKLFAKDQ